MLGFSSFLPEITQDDNSLSAISGAGIVGWAKSGKEPREGTRASSQAGGGFGATGRTNDGGRSGRKEEGSGRIQRQDQELTLDYPRGNSEVNLGPYCKYAFRTYRS